MRISDFEISNRRMHCCVDCVSTETRQRRVCLPLTRHCGKQTRRYRVSVLTVGLSIDEVMFRSTKAVPGHRTPKAFEPASRVAYVLWVFIECGA